VLVVAGGNHIAHGFGIPRRVFRRLPASYVLIGGQELQISKSKQKELMDVELPDYPMVSHDFLKYYAYEELPESGVLLGVAFEPTADKTRLAVKTVVPKSNAERAGVKDGDLLIALDGEQLVDSMDLIYALKQKHTGDRSTLIVERQGQQIKLDVVFEKTAEKQHGKP
jgi:predicted metalloprotease with PDZ domain